MKTGRAAENRHFSANESLRLIDTSPSQVIYPARDRCLLILPFTSIEENTITRM